MKVETKKLIQEAIGIYEEAMMAKDVKMHTGIKEIPMPDLDFCTRTLGGQIVLRSYEHGFLGAVSKGKFLGGV
jgi:hypothetical protein